MALYIVSTPIGNLSDITLRAIETLKKVDIIAVEDTRHSPILLKKYEIDKPMLSFHSFTEKWRFNQIVNLLKEGRDIALITDAGTPGVSDPGYTLIKAAADLKVKIIPIPGPAAFLAALCSSGLPMDKFLYLGFLPIKKGRKTLLSSLKDEKHTVVFYESPHRILKTFHELRDYLGEDCSVCYARELTKLHEEIFRGNLFEAIARLESKPIKGEFVIVLNSQIKKPRPE